MSAPDRAADPIAPAPLPDPTGPRPDRFGDRERHRDHHRVRERHRVRDPGRVGALPARRTEAAGAPLARRINRRRGRRGALFATRDHVRVVRTPREVKQVSRYVLLDARHHAAERGQRLSRGWLDPFSTAPWFEGWREPSRSSAPWLVALRSLPRPTAAATTWRLTTGWRRHGLLVVDDVPG